MTLVTEPTYTAYTAPPVLGIPHMLDGSRLMLRLLLRLCAVSFALVAVLVWLAPGATWESDIMLFKLALSLGAVVCTVGFWQASLPPVPPTVEVDIAGLEVRVVREVSGQAPRIIERCAFGDLEAVDLNGRHIVLWSRGGRLLADITLSNVQTHARLLAALRSLGKL